MLEILYLQRHHCVRTYLDFRLTSLKVEDTDEDTEVSDNSSPAPKGKNAAAVDSKVLDEWKRANGNNNKNAKSGANGAGAQKGPVKVSLANSKDSKMCEYYKCLSQREIL